MKRGTYIRTEKMLQKMSLVTQNLWKDPVFRQRVSLLHKDKVFSRLHCERISVSLSGEGNPQFGKKFDAAYRQKLSLSHTGKIPSAETCQKIRDGNLNKVVEDTTKQKMAVARTRWWTVHPEQRKEMALRAGQFLQSGKMPLTLTQPHRLFIQLFRERFGVELEVEFPLDDGSRVRFYDCKLPNSNVLFEVDGEYWHSFPYAKTNDQIKDTIAQNLGYMLYRVPESGVRDFVTSFEMGSR